MKKILLETGSIKLGYIKTVSIFFLIPPTSAFMAWLFLNEKLTIIDLFGFLVTSVGVYIATRDSKN